MKVTLGLVLLSVVIAGVAVAEPDPTRPAITSGSGNAERADSDRLPAVILNSIIFRETNASATINDEDYHVGDMVAGWQIRSIEYDRVLLENNGELVVLTVFSAPRRMSTEEF